MDSKGVGKPFTFASDEAKFHAWQKKVRNYVSAALPGVREFLEWAGDQGSAPISRDELETRYADKLRLLAQVEENLYTCLSSFTDGEAWSIASNTPEVRASRRTDDSVSGLTPRWASPECRLFPPEPRESQA